jgi:hypothetical protein
MYVFFGIQCHAQEAADLVDISPTAAQELAERGS